jgi:hypothetical protein
LAVMTLNSEGFGVNRKVVSVNSERCVLTATVEC